jgi:hypothetical protein
LNHNRALSFCFDAFSSNAFSSEVEPGSREENAFFYHFGANWNAKPVPTFAKFAPLNRYPLRSKRSNPRLMEALIPFPVPAIWSKDRPRKDISWRPARGRARGAPFFCAQFLSPAQGHDQKGCSSKSMARPVWATCAI